MTFRALAFASCIVAIATSASAQTAPTPSPIGQFGDWKAFQAGTGKGKYCFIISEPKSRKPDGLKRDPATLFITHRPGDGVLNEISVIAGFPLRETDAMIKIGDASFELYTREENAWVKDAAEQARVIDAMRKGANLVFEGVSGRGNKTTDSYSLTGVSSALDAISAACK